MYEVEVVNFLNNMYKDLEEDTGVILPYDELLHLLHFIGDQVVDYSNSITPVKTGNLINSRYYIKDNTGFTIGYTAEYAGYVHEILHYHHYHGRAKFLWDSFINVMISHLINIDRGDMPDFYVQFTVTPLTLKVSLDKGGGQLWRTVI